jgi:hypothetical protein
LPATKEVFGAEVKHFPCLTRLFSRLEPDFQDLQGFQAVIGLPDGTYDTIVIEAVDVPGGGVSATLTVTSGPQRGMVVTVVARAHAGAAVDLLGLPATLTVRDGEPDLAVER